MSFVKRNPFRVNSYESLKVAAQEIATKVFTNQTVEKIQNYSAKRVDKLTDTTIQRCVIVIKIIRLRLRLRLYELNKYC